MKHNPEDNEQDDTQLFRNAVAGVEPLRHDKTQPYHKRHRPQPLQLARHEADIVEFADTTEEAPVFLAFQRPGIQHRLYADLGRGLIPTEATLDLHGMRVVDARKALARFLRHSLDHGYRCIRIIHGKGQGSRNRQPVLKQRVNQWLQQRREILAFRSAPRWDGGTGAVYVLLSRKRYD